MAKMNSEVECFRGPRSTLRWNVSEGQDELLRWNVSEGQDEL